MIKTLSRSLLLALAAALAAVSAQAQPRGLPPAHLEHTAPQQMYSYAPLVQQVAPAVVNIYTKRIVRTSGSPLFNDPFFRRFLGMNSANRESASSARWAQA